MQDRWESWRLSSLPRPAKVVLTAFLVLIGFGYLSALGNMYFQHAMADGREGLTIDDLRVTFHGMEVPRAPGPEEVQPVARSRMLEMVGLGGEMRKHVSKGGAGAVRALEAWLERGATESEFLRKGLIKQGDPSPESVIARFCLRCHNAEDGEKSDAPYGPDIFTTDYQMVWKFAAPGTAQAPATERGDGQRATDRLGPHSMGHLFLITHIHMLSIPVFTVIISGLFLLTGLGPKPRGVLAPIPMLALVAEFAAWWLALRVEVLIYVIAAAGGVYGLTLGIQIIAVLWWLWVGGPSASPARARKP